jgi:hypothetical protein
MPGARTRKGEARSSETPPSVPHQLIPFLDHIADLLVARVKEELSRKSNLNIH